MDLNPAEFVIHRFGGVRATAKAIGRDKAAVSRWRVPKEKRGTDGRIPSLAQAAVLDAAKRFKKDITANDLIHGRRVESKSVYTIPGARRTN